MSKLTRQTLQLFGSSAGTNQIEQFGSLAAGSPTYLTPVAASIPTIQSLSAYLEGLFGAVVGSNYPSIQDINALFFLYAYQMCYMLQEGIPEYDSGTTYFTNSLCISSGAIYRSIVDNNTGNSLTNRSYWLPFYSQTPPTVQTFSSGSGTYTPSSALVTWIEVFVLGAGGGGSGGGTSPSNGGAGGTSSFGTNPNELIASGGGGGTQGSDVGPNTTSSIGTGFSGRILLGGSGRKPPVGVAGISSAVISGGYGGGTSWGPNNTTTPIVGSGGDGAYSATGGLAGGGGAGGDLVQAFSQGTLESSYAYAVGANGAAGTAGGGAGAQNGVNGYTGYIYVVEHYN